MDVVAPPETVEQNKFIRLECNEGWHWQTRLRSKVERCSEQEGESTDSITGPTRSDLTRTFIIQFPENMHKESSKQNQKSRKRNRPNKWQESSGSQSKKFYRTPTAMDKGDNSFKYAAKILQR